MKFLKLIFTPLWYISSLMAQVYSDVSSDMNVLFQSNTSFNFGPTGVSFFDFNNDGWDDITFVQETDSQVFYINNEGVFEKLPSFLYANGETKQVLWVDYDNDGDNDILVSSLYGPIKLYENDGNFNFTDVSNQAGLSSVSANNYGVSFGDYDKDGFLDLYVCRYVGSGDPNDLTQVNNLYHNNGDGTFTNVTFQAGVADSIQPSFQAIWIDYDKDTWPDLYVINDRNQWGNSLYKNNGDGTFTNVAIQTNSHLFGEDPMTATAGDFDNDGDLDIYMTNTALFPGPQHKKGKFLKNEIDQNNTFIEIAEDYGIDIPHYSWGATWVDFNNDSYQDLYVTTSRFSPFESVVRSYFYVNGETTFFIDSPSIFQNNHIARSFAVAKGDIDNDGYADLVVANDAPFNSFLWKNSGSNNNYIKITLEGTLSNKMAIGSWINVFAGGNRYTQYTMCGENFASQNSQHHIFGLGSYNLIDSIAVEYPSGLIDIYYNLIANEHYFFTEGETFSPEITIIGNTTFCQGDSVILDAGDFISYQWNNGDSGRYTSVKSSGFYNVLVEYVEDSFYLSNTVEITVKQPPIIHANIQSISCFDENDGTILLDIQTDAQNYQILWQNGQFGSFIENLSEGEYSFIYIDEFGCEVEELFYIENPQELNTQSLIINETDTLLGSIFLQVNGGSPPYIILLNGDTSQHIVNNLLAGSYNIEIFDSNQCFDFLDINIVKETLEQTPLSVDFLYENNNFRLHPNPLRKSQNLIIKSKDFKEEIQIYCIDVSGKIVHFFNLIPNKYNHQNINLSELDNGIYFLKIVQGNILEFHKLIFLK